MSDQNDNWRAKCESATVILVRPIGAKSNSEYGLPPNTATELRDQLTTALEEAKRLADPFERWWAGLLPHPQYPDHRFIVRRFWVGKEYARMIFERIRKAAPC